MLKIPDSGRGLVRCLVRSFGLAAAAMLLLSTAASERAEALSLFNPGAAATAKYVSDGLATEVRGGGGGGGGHGGGGYHGGRGGGGGAAFHASGIRSGGAVFHGGGYRSAHVFHGGGFGHRHHFHRRSFYGSSYYDYPYYSHNRRCRVIWTHHGPRRVCHFRHWRHRVYW
jgi:hypothetical protein